MKIRLNKDIIFPEKDVERIVIYIGEERFICEENSGKLKITKLSDGDSDLINIQPIVGNQVDIY